MGAGRWGSGGGGGGIHGAVTVSLDGGGGAALMTVTGIVCDREAGGAGGDGGLIVGTFAREIGGDGGLVTGGLRTRFAGLVDCGVAASFKQSCDWCKEDGTRTGGDRGSRMLCALATLALLVRFSFLGGGDGFCRVADGAGLGTMGDFANPLGVTSGLLAMESLVLCPCLGEKLIT